MQANGPWTVGPLELLQHASDHLRLGGDFDRRIAMISIDNAVELAIKTYLSLPERARGSKGPSRSELDSASHSFSALLSLLEQYAQDRLTGVDLNDIEWYHRLRNQLYHSGSGITPDRERVEAHFQIAALLFENLFGSPPQLDDSNVVRTRTGEFLALWNAFERELRAKLPPKDGYAYYWKRNFLQSISEEAAQLWVSLLGFRNDLVHSREMPESSEVNSRIEDLKRLIKCLERT